MIRATASNRERSVCRLWRHHGLLLWQFTSATYRERRLLARSSRQAS
jgi:hypothetical protein